MHWRVRGTSWRQTGEDENRESRKRRYQHRKLFSRNRNFVVSMILNPNQLNIVTEVQFLQQWNHPALGNLR